MISTGTGRGVGPQAQGRRPPGQVVRWLGLDWDWTGLGLDWDWIGVKFGQTNFLMWLDVVQPDGMVKGGPSHAVLPWCFPSHSHSSQGAYYVVCDDAIAHSSQVPGQSQHIELHRSSYQVSGGVSSCKGREGQE